MSQKYIGVTDSTYQRFYSVRKKCNMTSEELITMLLDRQFGPDDDDNISMDGYENNRTICHETTARDLTSDGNLIIQGHSDSGTIVIKSEPIEEEAIFTPAQLSHILKSVAENAEWSENETNNDDSNETNVDNVEIKQEPVDVLSDTVSEYSESEELQVDDLGIELGPPKPIVEFTKPGRGRPKNGIKRTKKISIEKPAKKAKFGLIEDRQSSPELSSKSTPQLSRKGSPDLLTENVLKRKSGGKMYRPFKCDRCEDSFNFRAELKKHQADHIDDPTPEIPLLPDINKYCEKCNKTFSSPQALKNHIFIIHSKKKTAFECNRCEKKFSDPITLKVHGEIHTGDYPYSCTICNKLFRFPSLLKIHMTAHSSARPFLCNQCPKSFKKSTHLDEHYKLHSDHYPFPCSVCPKSFRRFRDLTRHYMIHGKEQYFPCEKCKRVFSHLDEQKIHLSLHTRARYYQCNRCRKSFEMPTEAKKELLRATMKVLFCDTCDESMSGTNETEQNVTEDFNPSNLCEVIEDIEVASEDILVVDALEIHDSIVECSSEELVCNPTTEDLNGLVQDHTSESSEKSDLLVENSTVSEGNVSALQTDKSMENADLTENGHENTNVTENGSECIENTTENGDTHESIELSENSSIGVHELFGILKTVSESINNPDAMETSEIMPPTPNNSNTIFRPFPCPKCELTFFFRSELRAHFSKDHTEGTAPTEHECVVCKKSFSSLRYLKQHMFIHNVEYKCEICEESFSKPSLLKAHMTTHNGGTPYKCLECEKSFRFPSLLALHKLNHTGERPYVCKSCDKSFKKPSHLQEHETLHNEQYLFHCGVCFKGFKRLRDLKPHQATHTSEFAYQCTICLKGFNFSSALRQHMYVHGNREFRCDKCNKSFKQPSKLRSHSFTHANDTGYHCNTCDKSFKRFQGLQIHQLFH